MQKINLLPKNTEGNENDNVKRIKQSVQKQTRIAAQEPAQPQKQVPKQISKPVAKQPKTLPQQKKPGTESFGVNLMTEEMLSGITQQNKLSALGLFLLGSVFLVAVVYFGLTTFQRRIVDQVAEKEQRIAAIDNELSPLSAKKQAAAAFQKSVKDIGTLLDSHLYWTKFFSALEKYTVDSVFFTAMNGDQAGRLTLSARGTDYASVARQLVAFSEADDFVKDVAITSASLSGAVGGEYVTFSVSITLSDDVFFRDTSGGPVFEPS